MYQVVVNFVAIIPHLCILEIQSLSFFLFFFIIVYVFRFKILFFYSNFKCKQTSLNLYYLTYKFNPDLSLYNAKIIKMYTSNKKLNRKKRTRTFDSHSY